MSRSGLGTQLRHLLELLDGDLEQIYDRDSAGYRPRFTPIMRALLAGEPKTIGEIASHAQITHSAASQTVGHMVKAELLDSTVNEKDGRSKNIRISCRGRALLPKLERQWAATRAAADQLDSELPMPLSTLLDAAIGRLEERRFLERIDDMSSRQSGETP